MTGCDGVEWCGVLACWEFRRVYIMVGNRFHEL